MPLVMVTGMGVVTPIGNNLSDFWKALLAGTSGIRQVERFNTEWFPTHIAGEIRGFDFGEKNDSTSGKIPSMCAALGRSAGREALAMAGLDPAAGLAADLIIGTTCGDIFRYERACFQDLEENQKSRQKQEEIYYLLANPLYHFNQILAQDLKLQGRHTVISNACTAGGYAIAMGAERIRQGLAERVVCGGIDLLAMIEYAGFTNLRSLAPEKCQPFDKNRKGLILSEAAGLIVLESGEACKQRGAKPLAELAGYGWSIDGYHLSAPHPEGLGMRLAIERCLQDAGLAAGDIGGIIAHGTGTLSNDAIEAQVIQKIFGPYGVPVTAPKSMLGHSIGAASAVEAIIGVMSLINQILPPTINLEELDPECPIDCVAPAARPVRLDACLTNAAAFGGNNNALVFTRDKKAGPFHG